jgi:hypothetical protein
MAALWRVGVDFERVMLVGRATINRALYWWSAFNLCIGLKAAG